MYAGAAREAVFSKPEVIRRIRDGFIPLAMRATLVNGVADANDDGETWLYRRIRRAMLAPQGIGVLTSDGQVLTWVQTFEKDSSVLDFLDHSLKRFKESAAAAPPVVTERYMRFPGGKSRDFLDEAKLFPLADGHPNGRSCSARHAKGEVPPGSLHASLVGRVLDDQGKPVADVVNQEHYVEDQFVLTPKMQKELAAALAAADNGRAVIPDEQAKLWATHAHLGHIDVRPLFTASRNHNAGEWKRCEFRAEKLRGEKESARWRIEGESEVVSTVSINGKGVHDVKLSWEGIIEVQGARVKRLLLAARGTEKLQFAKDDHPLKRGDQNEVAVLPGGRPIDLECGVCYGIVAKPN